MITENTVMSLATAYHAGTASVNCATVDMSGYDTIVVIFTAAAIAAGSTADVRWEGGEESDASDFSDMTGTKVSYADDADDSLVYCELYQPTTRYVRAVLTKDGSNSVAGSAIYLRAKSKIGPVTQPSGTAGEAHASPAAGTA